MEPLLSTNVKSSSVGHMLTLVASCISKEHPDILEGLDEPILHVCLQEVHMDRAAWKVLTLVRTRGIKTINCITPDGSPHCIQLHYALEDVKSTIGDLKVNHWVVETSELIPVSPEAVKESRHLSRIEGRSQ